MPGLYGNITSNSNVAVGNTIGLYIDSGSIPVLNNAQQLLSILSNNGTVTFTLDPSTSNTKVEAFVNNSIIYSNANVASYLPTYNGALNPSTVTASGNIQAVYFLGNGSQLTGLPENYSNVNVAAYLPTYTGNLVSLTGNVITTANIQGAYIKGNGSQLTGLAGIYSNANVAAYLPIYGGNILANTVTVANIIFTGEDVVIGYGANSLTNGGTDVVIGTGAQGGGSIVAIGSFAGNSISSQSIAIGAGAGQYSQSLRSVGIGHQAAWVTQGAGAVALGYFAGRTTQGGDSVAVGRDAGYYLQGTNSVAIGAEAGRATQGNNSVAIGYQAGKVNQGDNSIIIAAQSSYITVGNAIVDLVSSNTKISLNNTVANGLVVTPIRNDTANTTVGLYYNTTTKEVTYATAVSSTYGNANVADFLANGFGSNTIVTTGNISANNFIGNGARLTAITGANVSGTVANATYAASAGTAGSATTATTATYVTGLTSANVTTALGYVPANSNAVSAYGDSNVATFLSTNFGSNVIVTTGNITAQNFIGNGARLTAITGANVTGTVANATYAASAGTAGSATTATTATYVTGLTSANVTTALGYVPMNSNSAGNYGNANVANFLANGFGSNAITTTGNITAQNFIGNGSTLTAITGANVTGTVASATLATTATYVTGLTSANVTTALGYVPMNSNSAGNYGNANVANFLANGFGSNVITTTGNVTAQNFIGNGSALTQITGANVTGTVGLAQYVTQAAQSNITSVGSSLTIGPFTIGSNSISSTNDTITIDPANAGSTGNVVIQGNLRVTGNIYAVESNIVTINDKNLVLANNQTTTLGIDGSGLWLGNINDTPVVSLTYSYALDAMTSNRGWSTASSNVTALNFIGNGSTLTNLTGANVSGAVANATYAASAGSATTATTATYVTGLTSANVTTALGYTPLDTNAASTYGNANVSNFLANGFGSNTIVTTGNITAQNFIGNGSKLTDITGANVTGTVPLATTSTYVTGLTSANVTTALGYTPLDSNAASTYGNANVANFLSNGFGSNTITTTGNITAQNFIGNGANLTNITAANINGTVANATYATNAGSAATATTATYVTGLTSANVTTALGYTPLDSNSANTYGNANVSNFLANGFGSNTIVTTGNITAGNLLGIGNDLTLNSVNSDIIMADTYGITLGINSNLSVPVGNVYVTNGNISTVNGYFIGNGSQLTGITGNYGNSNVVSLLASFGTNTIAWSDGETISPSTGNVFLGSNNQGAFGTGATNQNIFGVPTQTADVRIVGAHTVTGNSGAQLGAVLAGNLTMGRPNTNNGSRVRPVMVGGGIDTAGYASTLGPTPFSAMSATTLTRIPSSFLVTSYWNTNVGNPAVQSAAAGATNYLAISGADVPITYGIGTIGGVIIGGNFANSYIENATAFRAEFVNAGANAAAIGNKLVLESVDTAANIKIAGNIVSTAANIVAVGGVYSGAVTADHFYGNVSASSVAVDTITAYTGSLYVQSQLNMGTGYGITMDAANFTLGSTGSSNINIGTGNINITTGNVDIGAGYFIGNGSQLTGITGNYGDSNVISLMAGFNGYDINTSGNISVGTLFPNAITAGGADLDIDVGGSVNVNGNLRVGDNNTTTTISTHGSSDLIIKTHDTATSEANIYLHNGLNGNIDINATGTGRINLVGNVITTDGITAAGNISGNYFIGNGSLLTGITSSYGNSNVVSLLGSFGTNAISWSDGATINPATGNLFLGTNNQGAFGTGATNQNIFSVASQTADVRIVGAHTVTGNSGAQMGAVLVGNLTLGRPNTNNGARVRPVMVGGGIDTAGYISTLGPTPFSPMSVTQITRIPSTFTVTSLWNTNVGNPALTSAVSGATNYLSLTSADIPVTYGIGVIGGVIIGGNFANSYIENATAFRAEFVNAGANAAAIGNKLVLESTDTAANIKIAGNIVSTAANVVAVGAVYSGNVTASNYIGNAAALTSLTGAAAATYGDATTVAQITVDATGRITNISNVTITTTSSAGFNPFLLAGM